MAAIAALATVAAARAELRLGAPFTDGAVLQRGRAVPVWGTAAAGERVDVSFGRQTVSATAGEDGRWRVDLVPMAASASGRTLAAVSASGKAEAKDVLVGEVWLAGGQSNMEFPLCGTNPRLFDREGAAMAQAALRPELRFAMIGKRWSVTPQPDVQVDWRNCTPSNVCAGVSAIAFWYGLVLHDALRVPVGVVCAAWGGTCIEPWIPPQGYAKYPELDKWGKWPVTAEWKDEMKDTSVCAAHQQPNRKAISRKRPSALSPAARQIRTPAVSRRDSAVTCSSISPENGGPGSMPENPAQIRTAVQITARQSSTDLLFSFPPRSMYALRSFLSSFFFENRRLIPFPYRSGKRNRRPAS